MTACGPGTLGGDQAENTDLNYYVGDATQSDFRLISINLQASGLAAVHIRACPGYAPGSATWQRIDDSGAIVITPAEGDDLPWINPDKRVAEIGLMPQGTCEPAQGWVVYTDAPLGARDPVTFEPGRIELHFLGLSPEDGCDVEQLDCG